MKNENLKLAGKELYLRYPNADDFKQMAALYRRSRAHFRGVVQPRYDRGSFENLLAESKTEATEFFFIIRSIDNTLIGTIALSQIYRKRFQNAYLGYLQESLLNALID